MPHSDESNNLGSVGFSQTCKLNEGTFEEMHIIVSKNSDLIESASSKPLSDKKSTNESQHKAESLMKYLE